jgi:hypothetical protein
MQKTEKSACRSFDSAPDHHYAPLIFLEKLPWGLMKPPTSALMP